MYTNRVVGTAKCVLFIEVSSFQGVLIRGVPPNLFLCQPLCVDVGREGRNWSTTLL